QSLTADLQDQLSHLLQGLVNGSTISPLFMLSHDRINYARDRQNFSSEQDQPTMERGHSTHLPKQVICFEVPPPFFYERLFEGTNQQIEEKAYGIGKVVNNSFDMELISRMHKELQRLNTEC
ncbi:hypothetical protein STEG23_002139, partial [Scotinomys teguina]